MNKRDYKKAVKKLNCKYAKKDGICSLSKEFCPLGPCLDFKPKYSKRKLRKINRICERNKIIIEGKIIDGQILDFIPYLFCQRYEEWHTKYDNNKLPRNVINPECLPRRDSQRPDGYKETNKEE